MTKVDDIFKSIDRLLNIGEDNKSFSIFLKEIIQTEHDKSNDAEFNSINGFIQNLVREIDELITVIKATENILISVKNQKLLRICFQVITSFGILNSLIPGLGLGLSRLNKVKFFAKLELTDEQKYETLVQCTDFLHRSYQVPVLKNILITFHLSDYLAALIQLAFAPLKKPGVYKNFVMSEERYFILNAERKKYVEIYEHLVSNCFQPIVMKELLVLQNVKEVNPPMFVKRVIAKEMSRRLLISGGLISLIRCFIESHNIDTGMEWKKIDMICKIVCIKHGNSSESEYLNNICGQLRQIFTLNNSHYLTTAATCLLSLSEMYSENDTVNMLLKDVLESFDYDNLISQHSDPGTIVITTQELEQKILILHACICTTKVDVLYKNLATNLTLLSAMSMKCSNNNLKIKLKDIILKIIESLDKEQVFNMMTELIYDKFKPLYLSVEEYNGGLILKCTSQDIKFSMEKRISLLMDIFNSTESKTVSEFLFDSLLHLFLNMLQSERGGTLLTLEEDSILLNEQNEKYVNILLLLSEVSATPKATSILKKNPSIAIDFVENLLSIGRNSDECITISLVLLNSILQNNISEDLGQRLFRLKPMLEELTERNDDNSILCKEILSLIKCDSKADSAYSKALLNVFDSLLPVRAHGLIELTKLIDAADTEAISKRHYLFCLFQEYVKDSDSYIYLSAINGIASLATHCTEDVLGVLCKEFLQISTDSVNAAEISKKAELRMKIGDIVVKVTNRLGDMAIVHKTLLLNTFLCGCRDEEPLVRASALSNLAEVALVLHYRVGTIIYEILLCVWNIIETDKAIECRRAAVMVISSLLRGLGRDTLIELKDNLLPIYRTLNNLYKCGNEDSIVRLHSQIALEQLNDVVKEFLLAEVPMGRDVRVERLQEIKFK